MFDEFKIVRLTAPIFVPGDYERQAFAKAGLHPIIVDAADPDEIIRHVADADVVALIGTKLPTKIVDALARCRCISRMGTGTDRIDVARATELGILVTNTPYFCVEDQADHAMMMLLALARQLPLTTRAMAEGNYAKARAAVSDSHRISSSTLGLVGFGRSAVQLAQRARGFGMRVLAMRQNKSAPTDTADRKSVV